MSSKSEELYKKLFQKLNNWAEELSLDLKPDFVLTDFEKAAINAVNFEFPSAQSKGWHFHLAQSVYRQIQRNNLTSKYGNDQNLNLLIRHFLALAFLSPLEIPVAFDELKELLPEEAEPIIKWFDDNYVRGRHRRTLRNG
ncbi:hypothetical protein ACS0PU_000059 [Formica fusca]